MRDYAKVSPTFWTGDTGRKIRAAGQDCAFLALYLLTCPSAAMSGVFYLPISTVSYETGMTIEAASKALRRLSELKFVALDEERDLVWVVEMARHQIAERLEPKDKRHKGLLRELSKYSKSPILKNFWDKYGAPFRLPSPCPYEGHSSPIEAPSEPHRSQDQDQEQEQEQDPPKAPRESEPVVSESRIRVVPDLPPKEPTGKIGDQYVRLERDEWVAAYERAVNETRARVAGESVWMFQGKTFPALREVVEKLCPPESRAGRIAPWIERQVRDFVAAVARLDGNRSEPRFWSGYGPDGLQRWLNDGRPGINQAKPSVPLSAAEKGAAERQRRAAEASTSAEQPVSLAEAADESAKVLAMLRRRGAGPGPVSANG